MANPSRTFLTSSAIVIILVQASSLLGQVSSLSFGSSSYSFQATRCVPGTIAGTVSAPGAGYYTIAIPNTYLGVNSNNGQILLINYLTTNVPQTATVTAYVGPGFTGATATTQVTVTCSNTGGTGGTGTGGTGTGGTGTGGTATGLPVATQTPTVIQATTSASCTSIGTVIGTVTVTNAAQVVFGAATSGTPFLVSNTGQITLARAITPGTYTMQVTATNPFGTTTIPVNIIATCAGGGGTGTGGTGTGSPVFTQPQFALTASTLVPGVQIGQVTVNNPTGTTFSIISNSPGFTINPTTGVISLTGSPLPTPCTSQIVTVLATNSFGSSTSQVNINVPCNAGTGGGTGGTGGNASPVFTRTSYAFAPTGSTCVPGGTVGAVPATSATNYAISPSNTAFIINSQGIVTLTGNPALTSNSVYTFNVVATNAFGSTTVPVSIYAGQCTGGTGSGGTGGTGGNCGLVTFQQSPYTFKQTAGCTNFGTVGTVKANGCTGVTYSLPVEFANRFGIDPTSGLVYATIANQQCTLLFVSARGPTGAALATVPVYVDCTLGGSATCGANGGGTGTGTGTVPCTPGAFGCGDIG